MPSGVGFLRILILIDGKAGYQLAAVILKLRLKLGAGTKASTAARVKGAARRWIQRARQFAGQLDPLAPIVRIQTRRRRQQRLGVRMTRIVEDLVLGALLHAAAEIHHHHFISDVLDDRQVVGDKHVGQP